MDWKTTKNYKKLAVGRGLQELLVNMKKHSQANLVLIVFKNQNNQNEI